MNANEIVITNGCMNALNLSLRAVAKPGDTMLVETPTYFGLLQVIKSLGMKVGGVPATCVLIPSFGNPHGANLSDDRRRTVVDIARKRSVSVIEDDIYGELGFGINPTSTAQSDVRLNCALALEQRVLDAIDVPGQIAHQLNSPAKSSPENPAKNSRAPARSSSSSDQTATS